MEWAPLKLESPGWWPLAIANEKDTHDMYQVGRRFMWMDVSATVGDTGLLFTGHTLMMGLVDRSDGRYSSKFPHEWEIRRNRKEFTVACVLNSIQS